MTCHHCGGKDPSPGRVCGSPACIQRRARRTGEKALRKVERQTVPAIRTKQRARGTR